MATESMNMEQSGNHLKNQYKICTIIIREIHGDPFMIHLLGHHLSDPDNMNSKVHIVGKHLSLLPAKKVMLFAVPVTKVKCILRSKVLLQHQVNNGRIK